jgi:RNA polymerase sigma factor (sigma-70 family)
MISKSPNNSLLNNSTSSLLRLTRHMFHGYPGLMRWEQTDDIFQNAMIRLHRAMADLKIQSEKHFFNLAAVQIRRELLDLVKKYKAECSFAVHHHTDSLNPNLVGGKVAQQTTPECDLEKWTEFHQMVENMPAEEKDVVDLLWYQGLDQDQAAKILGISIRTLRRRWQAARIKLFEVLR